MAIFQTLSSKRLYTGALLLGLIAGAGLLFLKQGTSSPNDCAVDPSLLEKLRQKAKGGVAAFAVEKTPRTLPAFSYNDADNHSQVFSSAGKLSLLNFWATWCVPCREEMPALDDLQQKRGSAAFAVAPVSLDTGRAEKPKQFYSETKIRNLPFLHDPEGKVFMDFRKESLVMGLPTSFLVDKNNCILGTLAGPADWSGPDALALIDAALQK